MFTAESEILGALFIFYKSATYYKKKKKRIFIALDFLKERIE